MNFIPKQVFFTKGVGAHKEELQSFELALRDAGVEKYNLVTVSSIYPPGCKTVSQTQGLKKLSPGQVVFCVLSRITSNKPNQKLTASVGCAMPTDRGMYGYLSEHHGVDESEKDAGLYSENLAADMLASSLGIEMPDDLGWDEKKEIYNISDKIVKTTNYTQTAVVAQGKHTTVVSLAVFIL